MEKISAIVLAAGKGTRMKSDRPKQFMEVAGKPLIAYSLEAFEKSDVDEIILVTGQNEMELCSRIIKKFKISRCVRIVAGGDVRALSVYNGIKAASGDYVLIHDGARPLVSQRLIADTIEAVEKYKAAVPVIPVKDTIRQVSPDGTLMDALDRSTLFSMQTPQAFACADIMKAYEKLTEEKYDLSHITDDVMVMEQGLGIHAHPVRGEEENRKITTPEDLEWLKTRL
ncbi:MAG: 2-C-methyl-D-erythritol 4-phosphate cytidylyltransferase [Lachnospiraceae bacterium]|nr:2-C-methyl-D-erythritol 4-phosphate cytidylyltransferase [Lachnospiraceae bacterium]MDY2759481.1 2-C-methyl-D-erythritol 4-phosphate cytidylyltransferase [Lachnospiraceae bacterium]